MITIKNFFSRAGVELFFRHRGNIDHGISTDRILRRCLDIFKEHFDRNARGTHLDVGVGTGTLCRLIQAYAPNFDAFGVDCMVERVRDPKIQTSVVDISTTRLPYEDESFDFVSCVEVLEHLENYRFPVREIFRVLKPGGTVVITTPNVLSLKSRIRYFLVGFPTLFGPLNLNRAPINATTDHITPIGYFFLSHLMAETGFKDITVQVDKYQRSAILPFLIFYPIIRLLSLKPIYDEKRTGRLNAQNNSFFQPVNSVDLLMGRTIILRARKA